MKTRLLVAAVLAVTATSALAHDPSAHMRHAPATPVECAPFEGKDPASINLKDAAVKTAFDKCEAAKKEAKAAADAMAEAEQGP